MRKALLVAVMVLAVDVAGTSACPFTARPHSVAIPVVAPRHNGSLSVVSCSSQGNCEGVGYFTTGKGHSQMWSVAEVAGKWHWADRLIVGSSDNAPSSISAMACPSPGNCVAVGSRESEPSMIEETSGTWGKAVAVPLPADAAGLGTGLTNVSCPDAGDCVATGSYTDSAGHDQPLLVEEVSGSWGAAVSPRNPASDEGEIDSVSCPAAGYCAAVGSYSRGKNLDYAQAVPLVLRETAGAWTTVPANNRFGAVSWGLKSVSCPAAGTCVAVGSYTDGSHTTHPLVVDEVKGYFAWKAAHAVKLPAGASGPAGLSAVSCSTAGYCSAVGEDVPQSGNSAGFFVDETAGYWLRGVAAQPPADGFSSLQPGLASIVCSSPGNCTAYGGYEDPRGAYMGLIASESSRVWSREITASVPLDARPSVDPASIACASQGNCVARGSALRPDSGKGEPFVLRIFTNTQPPAPTCRVTPAGGSAISKRGTLTVNVKCSQKATYALAGAVDITRGGKTEAVAVAPQQGSARAGVRHAVTLRLPATALAGLAKHAKEAAALYVNAGNANGSRFAYLTVHDLHS